MQKGHHSTPDAINTVNAGVYQSMKKLQTELERSYVPFDLQKKVLYPKVNPAVTNYPKPWPNQGAFYY